jgi:hypothetical protein
MLPNLKFLVGGILFCILLFAVAGAGVMAPDSRTRIGEMPEIGRPMMQRSMADLPVQAQVNTMTAARRSDEREWLSEAAPVEAAPAQPEPEQPEPDTPKSDRLKSDLLNPDLSQPNLAKPDVVASIATPDGAKTANPTPDGAPAEGGATAVQAPPVHPPETRSDDRTDKAAPPLQVAALAPAAEESASVPRYVNVPLPPPRPAFLHRHTRMLHRRYRPLQQYDTASPAGQAAPSSAAALATPGVAAGYPPSEAGSRPSH